MRMTTSIFIATMAAALLLACSDDTVSTYDLGKPDGAKADKGQVVDKGKTDGKPLPDHGKPPQDKGPPPPDKAPPKPDTTPPGPFTCASDCSEYVIKRLIMPTNNTTSLAYALVHKGKKYNALGSMISLLIQQAPSLELQPSVDNDICAGKTINLLRVKAKSLTSQTAVNGQWWVGLPFGCCSKSICLDSKTKTECEAGSKLKCFGGTGKFQVDKSKPHDLYMGGGIKGGALSLAGKKMAVRLSLSKGGGMEVPLKVASVSGQITKAEIKGGVLAGGVDQTDVATKVVPAMALILDGLYKKTKDKTTKDMIKKLFDPNNDGQITSGELANNALIKSYLAGDVDVDGDGKKEVSVGLAFTAVRAAINTN